MKILKCIICQGEIDIVLDGDRSINKKVRCKKCGFSNSNVKETKEPEIVIIKRRPL